MALVACCVSLPRSLSMQHPSSSLLLMDAAAAAEDNAVSVGIGVGTANGRRRSLSYYRLPEPLIRLSILKLDDSSFDLQVPKDACVLKLKATIEDIFSRSSNEEGCRDISWSHVWGHFCLCYNDYKLIDDKESLIALGIKDGDQLCFVRHLSLNYKPIKRRSKSFTSDLHLHSMSLSGPDAIEKVAEINKDKNSYHIVSSQYVDEGSDDSNRDHVLMGNKEFKLRSLFRWFSYSKLENSQRGKSRSHIHPKMAKSLVRKR